MEPVVQVIPLLGDRNITSTKLLVGERPGSLRIVDGGLFCILHIAGRDTRLRHVVDILRSVRRVLRHVFKLAADRAVVLVHVSALQRQLLIGRFHIAQRLPELEGRVGIRLLVLVEQLPDLRHVDCARLVLVVVKDAGIGEGNLRLRLLGNGDLSLVRHHAVNRRLPRGVGRLGDGIRAVG